jgi:hypothetical protein
MFRLHRSYDEIEKEDLLFIQSRSKAELEADAEAKLEAYANAKAQAKTPEELALAGYFKISRTPKQAEAEARAQAKLAAHADDLKFEASTAILRVYRVKLVESIICSAKSNGFHPTDVSNELLECLTYILKELKHRSDCHRLDYLELRPGAFSFDIDIELFNKRYKKIFNDVGFDLTYLISQHINDIRESKTNIRDFYESFTSSAKAPELFFESWLLKHGKKYFEMYLRDYTKAKEKEFWKKWIADLVSREMDNPYNILKQNNMFRLKLKDTTKTDNYHRPLDVMMCWATTPEFASEFLEVEC